MGIESFILALFRSKCEGRRLATMTSQDCFLACQTTKLFCSGLVILFIATFIQDPRIVRLVFDNFTLELFRVARFLLHLDKFLVHLLFGNGHSNDVDEKHFQVPIRANLWCKS